MRTCVCPLRHRNSLRHSHRQTHVHNIFFLLDHCLKMMHRRCWYVGALKLVVNLLYHQRGLASHFQDLRRHLFAWTFVIDVVVEREVEKNCLSVAQLWFAF